MSDHLPAVADIETEADVRAVVDAFYHDIEQDPHLGRFFRGIDMAAHLPKMYSFWSSVVFQTGAYRGRPFDPHAAMDGLAPDHFAAWLRRFHATVDARFLGPKAAQMKARADQIGQIFQWKLGLLSFVDADVR